MQIAMHEPIPRLICLRTVRLCLLMFKRTGICFQELQKENEKGKCIHNSYLARLLKLAIVIRDIFTSPAFQMLNTVSDIFIYHPKNNNQIACLAEHIKWKAVDQKKQEQQHQQQ